MKLKLNPDDSLPLYRQIYRQIRASILAGTLAPGTQLPPTRRLAEAHDVARLTVTAAYEQLQNEGYITARRGAGTFVAPNLPPPLSPARPLTPALSAWGERLVQQAGEPVQPTGRNAHPAGRREIDFGFGRAFATIFPYDVWRRLLARYLSTDDAILARYGSVAGFDPLRRAVAEYLTHLRGVRCTAEQVVIVSGTQQALDILARLLLGETDEVLVESPGYAHAFKLFRVYGATLVPLPVDEEGFPVGRIPAGSRARFAFVTPSNQFPHGGAMPLARRLALLAWARQNEALILEDDYDGELRYDGHPLAALQGLDQDGRVIYLGTFSKVLFPTLRLGYIVLPDALREPFLQAKQLMDRGAPTLTQAAVADFIREGHFESHLRRLRKAYARRRAALVEALEAHLGACVTYSKDPAGLQVMVYLPAGCDEQRVIREAAGRGVAVYPGAPYHLIEPVPPSILLGFSGLRAEEIVEGVRRLADVIPCP